MDRKVVLCHLDFVDEKFNTKHNPAYLELPQNQLLKQNFAVFRPSAH